MINGMRVRSERTVMAGGLLGGAVLLLWMGRGVTPIGDEWSWFGNALDPSASTVFGNHNGHLMVLTQGIYSVGPRVFGLEPYWPYRLLAVLAHLLLVVVVHLYARRRLGGWWALLPAASFLLLGTAADDMLTPINVAVPAAGASGVLALLALERRTARGDAAAAVALLVGLASYSNAIPFVAVVVVELISRREWRRMWIPLAAGLPYLVWRLIEAGGIVGSTGTDGASGVVDAVLGAVRAGTAAVAGLLGVQLASHGLQERMPWLDEAAVAAFVPAAALFLLWLKRAGHLRPRVLGLIAGCAVLWFLLGVGRGGSATMANRYVGKGAVLVLLLFVEVGRDVRLGARSRAVTVGVVVLVAACLALNVVWMSVWGDQLRDQSATARAGIGSYALAGPTAPRDLRATDDFVLVALPAGTYHDLIERFGRISADSPTQLASATEANRRLADGVLLRAAGPRIRLGGAPGRPVRPSAAVPSGPWRATMMGCLALPRGATGAVDLRAPGGRYVVAAGSTSMTLSARRFADAYVAFAAPRSGSLRLDVPEDDRGRPWRVRATADGPARICGRR